MLNYLDKLQQEGYAVFLGGDEKEEPKQQADKQVAPAHIANAKSTGEPKSVLNSAKKANTPSSEATLKSEKIKAGGQGKLVEEGVSESNQVGAEVKHAAESISEMSSGGFLDYSRFDKIDAEDEEALEALAAGFGGGDELAALEGNPLWTTILRIAGGDGAKALELMQDPDALQTHPEIMRLFEQDGKADDLEEEST